MIAPKLNTVEEIKAACDAYVNAFKVQVFPERLEIPKWFKGCGVGFPEIEGGTGSEGMGYYLVVNVGDAGGYLLPETEYNILAAHNHYINCGLSVMYKVNVVGKVKPLISV